MTNQITLYQATGILTECVERQAALSTCAVCNDDLTGDVFLGCDFPVVDDKIPATKKDLHNGHVICGKCCASRDYVGEKGACAACLMDLGNRRTAVKTAGVAKIPAPCIGKLTQMIDSLRDAQEQIKACQEANDDARIAEGAQRRAVAVDEVRKKREEAEAEAERVRREAEAEAERITAAAKRAADEEKAAAKRAADEEKAEAKRVAAAERAEAKRAAEVAKAEAKRVAAEEAGQRTEQMQAEKEKNEQDKAQAIADARAEAKRDADAALAEAQQQAQREKAREVAHARAEGKREAEAELVAVEAVRPAKKPSRLDPDELARRRESAKRRRDDTRAKLEDYDRVKTSLEEATKAIDKHEQKIEALKELCKTHLLEHQLDPNLFLQDAEAAMAELDADDSEEEDSEEEEEEEEEGGIVAD